MVDINYPRDRQKLLEKRLGPAKQRSWQERLLLKHKIFPLVNWGPLPKEDPSDPDEEQREGFTSILGKGKYGTAFRAVYKGKEVAVKITEEASEAANWEMILQIAETAPPDITRHLPKIYDIITDDEILYGDETIYMIVMELLVPIPQSLESLKSLLFKFEEGGSGGTKQELPLSMRSTERIMKGKEGNIADLMKDETLLYSAFNVALDEARNKGGITFSENFKQNLFKQLLNFKPLAAGHQPLYDFPIFAASAFVQALGTLSPDEKKEVLEDLAGKPPASVGQQIGNDMIVYFRNMTMGGNFPWTHNIPDEDREVYRNIPGAASLLKALEYLESYGIGWHDIHSGNVMMRPSTKDLVIIDVGLYEQ